MHKSKVVWVFAPYPTGKPTAVSSVKLSWMSGGQFAVQNGGERMRVEEMIRTGKVDSLDAGINSHQWNLAPITTLAQRIKECVTSRALFLYSFKLSQNWISVS